MNRTGSQARTLGVLLEKVRPYWRSDRALPARIDQLLRSDKRFGSRDRRLYRELLYTAVRYAPWVEPHLDTDPDEAFRRIGWLAADSAATAGFREAVSGGLPPCPPTLAERAQLLGVNVSLLSPPWLSTECPEALASPLADLLRTRAPLWIRLQVADPSEVFSEFAARAWKWQVHPDIPGAVRVDTESNVASTQAYERGLFEVQDIGSQAILAAQDLPPGTRWLDACAGAGGKSLQLAQLLGPEGRVDASEPRQEALRELALRVARAGLDKRIVRTQPGTGYDGVLVDAPCSGSGTWRRAPHLIWTTTQAHIARFAELQKNLLAENAPRVKPGGVLVYATCSLCRTENEDQIRTFLETHPRFAEVSVSRRYGSPPGGPGLRLWPQLLDGDAFYVATLRRLA